MNSVNRVELIGTIGKDAETKTFSANKVTSFCLATSKGGYTGRDGKEVPEVTQWHNVDVWDCKLAEGYAKKGCKVYVMGELTYRTYEKDGQKHTVTTINVQGRDFIMLYNPNQDKKLEEAAGKITDAYKQANKPIVQDDGLPF